DPSSASLLDVGPDFFPAFARLGNAISLLDTFTECLCEPANDIVIAPLFAPFRGAAFAAAANATLSLPLVFITQGVLRPIVRSFQNAQNPNITDVADILVRPSFNSTFDTAT